MASFEIKAKRLSDGISEIIEVPESEVINCLVYMKLSNYENIVLTQV